MAMESSQKATILIVDDTPDNLDILRRVLEYNGYNVQVALSGEIALKVLNGAQLPDLILLDIMMPGMDGYQTCQKIKENEFTRNIPVIFLTAKNEIDDIVQGFSVGGVDYICKPFRHEELCSRVKTHLQLNFLKKELELKNKNLKILNDLKNTFIGMAAHDLRNPLISILGFSEILKEDIDDLSVERRNEYIEFIYAGSEHMLNLVNDLLDVSVIESGKLQLQIKKSSLKKLIEERVHLYETVAQKKNITLTMELNDIPEFQFDPDRISQVLDNLITNAIKFSSKGKIVKIKLKADEKFVKVLVCDEGPGISVEDQAKLFKDFPQLTSKPTGGESSTGLGLAIAKKMLEYHGSSLQIESMLGKGAIFSFELPLNRIPS
jgi:two-component system, sensor histidine kinase and response regulator